MHPKLNFAPEPNKLNESQQKDDQKMLKGYKYPIMELRPQPERIFYASYDGEKFIIDMMAKLYAKRIGNNVS